VRCVESCVALCEPRHVITPCTGIGGTLLHLRSCRSTQTLLCEALPAAPPLSCCLADEQTGGRGRTGNSWTSPPGCLLMSSVHSFRNAAALLSAQYAVTLGVVRAVERELPQLCGVLRIKWPNDIYVLRPLPVKIGGVLVQSSCSSPSPSFRLVAGVGLNVTNSHPSICLADLCPTPRPIDIGALCGSVFQELNSALCALDDGGLAAIKQVPSRPCGCGCAP
jgi:biotin-[acetyl-CoA-carboxylase] ligase BirA-like protein